MKVFSSRKITILTSISSNLNNDFRWWLNILADKLQANFILAATLHAKFLPMPLLRAGRILGPEPISLLMIGHHCWWSDEKWALRINALKLRAAFYELKCFTSHLNDCEILLRIVNTTRCLILIVSVQMNTPTYHLFLKKFGSDVKLKISNWSPKGFE